SVSGSFISCTAQKYFSACKPKMASVEQKVTKRTKHENEGLQLQAMPNGSPSPPLEERAGPSSEVLLTKEGERRPFSRERLNSTAVEGRAEREPLSQPH